MRTRHHSCVTTPTRRWRTRSRTSRWCSTTPASTTSRTARSTRTRRRCSDSPTRRCAISRRMGTGCRMRAQLFRTFWVSIVWYFCFISVLRIRIRIRIRIHASENGSGCGSAAAAGPSNGALSHGGWRWGAGCARSCSGHSWSVLCGTHLLYLSVADPNPDPRIHASD
jgi:hypothetical protein